MDEIKGTEESKQQMKFRCLDLACRAFAAADTNDFSDAEEVVDAAKKFYEFVIA